MDPRIESASRENLDEVSRLLADAHLPLDGLCDHIDTAVVARAGGVVVGCAALEMYDGGALMRSLAVAPTLHGQHIGRRLTEAMVDLARERGAPALYLLTTTAVGYFPKFGFERITRADVPASVTASIEFASACPSTATVMRKWLRDTP